MCALSCDAPVWFEQVRDLEVWKEMKDFVQDLVAAPVIREADSLAGYRRRRLAAMPSAANLNAPLPVLRSPRQRLAPSRQPCCYLRWGKRALDIALVILTLPLSVAIVGVSALMLWVEGGSPFYSQKRLGKDGRVFTIWKLRTMVRDAEARLAAYLDADPALRAEWTTHQKLKKDPRITRVGAALRMSSMDELPQLWNVLIGDMSLVGPRPMMPEQLSHYGDPAAYFALKPGITGIWQVSARNEHAFSYRAKVDAIYHATATLRGDLGLMFRTVGVVVRGTGY